jgi:hypothetical protein
MRFLRAQAFLATAVVTLALQGCDDPVQRTDLRPAGPPDVLTVLVMDDPIGFLYETATFCKANDDKAPTLVGVSDFTTLTICPEAGPVTGAVPQGWYARVMFDELLDPDVEELLPVDPMDPDTTYTGSLLRTQPVTLTCAGATVAYDGWYAPNGNNVSWPLGPSLVIVPLEFVATSAECSLMLKDTITDKDGNQVPMDQRGPFTWEIGALEVVGTDPESGSEIAADAQVGIFFNAPLDPATVTEGTDVVIAGPGAAGATVSVSGTDILIDPPGGAWTTGAYTVTIPTTATITDERGGVLTLAEDLVIDFTIP